MTRKSHDSSKFDRSFWEVEVFLPQYNHDASSEVGGLSRKIYLEQKSMEGKFDDFVKMVKNNYNKLTSLKIQKKFPNWHTKLNLQSIIYLMLK